MKKASTKNHPDPVEIDETIPEPPKIKKEKAFDLEGHEIFPIDKIDDPEVVVEEAIEEEETEDGTELDEEEINPFKDKWEE